MLAIISEETSVRQLTSPSSHTVRATTGRAVARARAAGRKPRRAGTSKGYTGKAGPKDRPYFTRCTSSCGALLDLRRRAPLLAEDRGEHEPSERQRHEQVGQKLAVTAVRPVR